MSRRRNVRNLSPAACLLALLLAACSAGDVPNSAGASSAPVASDPATPSAAPQTHALPTPTGPFAVGMRELDLLGDPGVIEAWYPAERGTGSGHPAYASPSAAANVWSEAAATMATIEVQAELDASPAADAGSLPVVIAIPYDVGVGSAWRVMLTELASNGFLAVLVEPRHFPGPDATAGDVANDLDRLGRVIDALTTDGDLAARIGAADPARIAVGGHSAGGSLAFELALIDDRVDAVFDLDGALWRQALAEPVSVPALMVLTELGFGGHRDYSPDTFTVLAETPQLETVGVEGADHPDPVDFPLVAQLLGEPLPGGPAGGIATTSVAEIVQRFLHGVLDEGTVPTAAALAEGVPNATATAGFLSSP